MGLIGPALRRDEKKNTPGSEREPAGKTKIRTTQNNVKVDHCCESQDARKMQGCLLLGEQSNRVLWRSFVESTYTPYRGYMIKYLCI